MKKLFFQTLFMCILIGSMHAQHIVDGHIFLENMGAQENVKVVFERMAPTSIGDSVYTDSNGYFKASVGTGIYHVTFLKSGYFYKQIKNLSVNADTTLADDTLAMRKSLIRVPQIISSIQEAIDQADDDDTILISKGTYSENLNIEGKNIVLASNYIFTKDSSSIAQTIIDGHNNGAVIEMFGSPQSSLIGLTITKGSRGGVNCYVSNVLVSNVIFTENAGGSASLMVKDCKTVTILNTIITKSLVSSKSGGLSLEALNSDVTIRNSNIYNNSGEIYINTGTTRIFNTLIYKNSGSWGGGIKILGLSSTYLYNVTIANNTSSSRGTISLVNYTSSSDCYFYMYNSILYGNKRYGIYHDPFSNGYNVSIAGSDFYGNEMGPFYNLNDSLLLKNITLNAVGDSCDFYFNISTDPRFVNVGTDDYRLRAISPCIDAGCNPCIDDGWSDSTANLFDCYGQDRIMDGNHDGSLHIDIGASEHKYAPLKISGEISTNAFSGYIYLYLKDSTSVFTLKESKAFDSSKVYSFEGLDYGEYILLAGLDITSTEYENYLPTYFGNVNDMNDAIIIEESGKDYDIKMIPLMKIEGKVVSGTDNFGTIVLLKKDTSGNFSPFDSMNFSFSGQFEFKGLLEGSYSLLASLSASSSDFGHYFPTYYGDVTDIQNAMSIESSGQHYDIVMKHREIVCGYVHAGNSSFGYVYLIQVDSASNYVVIDSTTFDTSGYYKFNYFKQGNYTLLAIEDLTAPDYMYYAPTYYGDIFDWNQSLTVNSIGSSYDIYMEECNILSGGPGSIDGKTVRRLNGDEFDGAENMLVILTNLSSDVFSYRYTDQNGNFDFSGLPYGTYQLHVEILGVESFDFVFEIKPDMVAYSGLMLQINMVSNIVTDQPFLEILGLPAPNPVSDLIRLPYYSTRGRNLNIDIFNVKGQVILREIQYISALNSQLHINVGSLESGIYYVRIRSSDYEDAKVTFEVIKD